MSIVAKRSPISATAELLSGQALKVNVTSFWPEMRTGVDSEMQRGLLTVSAIGAIALSIRLVTLTWAVTVQ